MNSRGKKQVLAIEDGVRESTQPGGNFIESESTARTEPTGIDSWGRGHGVLGSLGGNLFEHRTATLLVPQDEQSFECVPVDYEAQGATGVARDLAGGPKLPQAKSLLFFSEDLLAEVFQEDCMLTERSGGVANILRISSSSLGDPAHHESN